MAGCTGPVFTRLDHCKETRSRHRRQLGTFYREKHVGSEDLMRVQWVRGSRQEREL